MRNVRRLFVLLAALCAVATWSSSAQAPSLRERTRALLSQAGRSAGLVLTKQQARDAFEEVAVVNSSGAVVVGILADEVGDGAIVWANRTGETAPRGAVLVSEEDAGRVAVFNTAGQPRFILDGNLGLVSAAGDMAEVFPSATGTAPPGSVMSIDPARPGALRIANVPHDRRVAGVVSGARDYRPGITLNAGETRRGAVTLTLSGTVYCRATSVNGPIRAGDLLTSSAVPGHAMRAGDGEAARGSVLGKALEDLRGERGEILILAALQ
jgi:hypothetical protein